MALGEPPVHRRQYGKSGLEAVRWAGLWTAKRRHRRPEMKRYALPQVGTFVGLDVHKRQVVAAMLLPDGELLEGAFATTDQGLRKLRKWVLARSEGAVQLCYEAGSSGFALQRQLGSSEVPCMVVAPSCTPRRAGDLVKTDRRDARKLAELLRAGLLTEVHPPTEEEEGVRDLIRCREDARRALHCAKQQVLKFLDRKGLLYTGSTWTLKHWAWLRGLRLEGRAAQFSLEQYLLAVEQDQERLATLDREIGEVARSEPYRELVGMLCSFRGIDTLTAMILLGEVYEFGRFSSPRELMSFLGLTPSEESSGERERRKGITKTGNRHVRRVLVQVAWQYARRPGVGVTLTRRREGQPGWVIALADKAMQRLTRRYQRLVNRGKSPGVAVIAVARELVGFLWALLRPERSGEGGGGGSPVAQLGQAST
jgi:transposase